jgi:hypothetical protein
MARLIIYLTDISNGRIAEVAISIDKKFPTIALAFGFLTKNYQRKNLMGLDIITLILTGGEV